MRIDDEAPFSGGKKKTIQAVSYTSLSFAFSLDWATDHGTRCCPPPRSPFRPPQMRM
jgi:hypothetical protein